MSFKCSICIRTFSQYFAYTQHSQKCLKYVEIEIKLDKDKDKNNEEEYSSEMDTRSNQSSEHENDEVELENDNNNVQNMSFDSIESVQSNLISEISTMSFEDNLENILDLSKESEISEKSENSNFTNYIEFPNDAYYKDLMLLVTNHKLNNKAANEIICFFNKHSNLTESLLSKNIEQERTFMNNMKFSNLKFNKLFLT
ncbi:hypothetical protein RclHR1_07650003 [Rhizophagus clarus]|uniref:Uncharacterized protein n=1 Tax=Rhizophagus clarus TaxID=94130 RepID=A0A2Z6RXJ5_9GLOM|nr:hypothetical protein RclHR1_07650003 [Rhizophagus clarus]